MNGIEKQQVFDEVIRLIENEYHTHLMDAYATTVALVEKHPDQVNNEVRNAFNHAARAMEATTLTSANEELQKARRHLDRAIRDCLKLSILHMREKLDSIVQDVARKEGEVPLKYRNKLKDLRKLRRDTLRKEISGQDEVTNEFLSILNDCFKIEDELLDDYPYLRKYRKRFYRIFIWALLRWKNLTSYLIVTILSAFIGLEIGARVGSDPPSETVMKWFTSDTKMPENKEPN